MRCPICHQAILHGQARVRIDASSFAHLRCLSRQLSQRKAIA